MAIKDLFPISKKHSVARQSDWDSPFLSLQNEMNRLFNSFFQDSGMSLMKDRFYDEFPKIDVKDLDKSVEVTAELPGLDKKDVDISVSGNMLMIHGEKKEEKEEKKDSYYYSERAYGSFHRNIPLYAEIDEDKVEAKFKNGVLKLKLPKTPEAQRKTQSKNIQIS